jgi:predicted dehydrogenase
MKQVRVGIVGAGFAARFHVECLRRIWGTAIEIAGITSPRLESRNDFGRKHGIKVFDDVNSMLRNVDVVDICSPPYVHEEAILAAAKVGVHVICEKPLTGYFGLPGVDAAWHGDKADKAEMLENVLRKLKAIENAVKNAGTVFCYGENFVYAPSIQKEREIIEKTGAQVLRQVGEESHNGSASDVYGIWRFAGGGSLIGKGCHPLSAVLYFKRVEGMARGGQPIRPKTIISRTHQLTRLPEYQDKKLIRTDYHDIEDFGLMHVIFEDGTVADVMTGEVTLGGIYDYVEVFANNHRTRCHISPTGLVDTYNPRGEQYQDIYVIEKVSTKEGWSQAAPDENLTIGYQAEMQDFITCIAEGRQPQSGLDLAVDTTAAIYAAYLSDQNKGAETPVPQL